MRGKVKIMNRITQIPNSIPSRLLYLLFPYPKHYPNRKEPHSMATVKRRTPWWRRSPASNEDKYLQDPRWREAKVLADRSEFERCNQLVTAIMRSYGKLYGRS